MIISALRNFNKPPLSSALPARLMHIKRIELYQKCCRILGVEATADQNTVRRAYIELVKKVHPDSGTPEASAERFQQVDEAFKALQAKFAKNRRGIYEDDDEKVFDIRHTAPQHRQYLNYDGWGMGTPYQREKQYQQLKAMKAQQRVLDHRLEKSQAQEHNVMKKGSYFKSHAIKTKYGFDRVVEDLIQEAMSKGDFNKLAGVGKPLSSAQSQNPYLDFTTHKLNKILQDNGFTPEWITMQRDIRQAIDKLRQALREERAFFGDYPFVDEAEADDWQRVVEQYETDLRDINKSIDKYNLIVPIMDKQMFRVNLQEMAATILNDPNAVKHFKRKKGAAAVVPNAASEKKSDLFSFISSIF